MPDPRDFFASLLVDPLDARVPKRRPREIPEAFASLLADPLDARVRRESPTKDRFFASFLADPLDTRVLKRPREIIHAEPLGWPPEAKDRYQPLINREQLRWESLGQVLEPAHDAETGRPLSDGSRPQATFADLPPDLQERLIHMASANPVESDYYANGGGESQFADQRFGDQHTGGPVFESDPYYPQERNSTGTDMVRGGETLDLTELPGIPIGPTNMSNEDRAAILAYQRGKRPR